MEKIYTLFKECTGVSTDTRNIQLGSLFVCLKGANFNANTFAEEALNKGAKYVIIDEEKYLTNPNMILVDDALKTLQDLANYHRLQFNIPIIGITGSNGKTTTKELTAHLLSSTYNTHYTKGNLNNHIGVPLTLLQLNKDHQIAIIEMGANHPNDIQELCDIALPNYGIISNIGKAHLEGFKSLEGVIKTKTDLYRSVIQRNGRLFVNFDDAILKSQIPDSFKNVTYYSGENNQVSIKGKLERLTPFIEFSWMSENYQSPILSTQIIGEYNFVNLLAAITVATHFDVKPEAINTAILNYKSENNRSQIQKTDRNTLLLDAYNANPSSMNSAIRSFSKIEVSNKLMILGDMFELGEESVIEHRNIAELALETNINTFFVGKNFYSTKLENSNCTFFESKERLTAYLQENPITDALILLKGSRGIALETIINLL